MCASSFACCDTSSDLTLILYVLHRTAVEDGYVKSLTKMNKTILHVPDSSMG